MRNNTLNDNDLLRGVLRDNTGVDVTISEYEKSLLAQRWNFLSKEVDGDIATLSLMQRPKDVIGARFAKESEAIDLSACGFTGTLAEIALRVVRFSPVVKLGM